MNERSLAAYYNLDVLNTNRWYQRLLGALSIRPMTRQQLEEFFENELGENKGNTIRPRLKELMAADLVAVVGESRTKANYRAELLGLTVNYHELMCQMRVRPMPDMPTRSREYTLPALQAH